MKVLVVEDEPRLAEALVQLLRDGGWEADTAADGPAGLALARAGGYSAAVLDVMLPGLDGWSVCRKIRETSKAPIIMLTAKGELEDKVNAKTLEVDLQLPEEPVPVWGDQDAITQVCYNLLDNAIKFSREGGTLGASVSVKGPKATITISNQGDTIPAEEQSLVFDRFHKTDHSRSADRDGVGLGLYIVKTILNSHKETITCASGDGVTKFVFTLTRA